MKNSERKIPARRAPIHNSTRLRSAMGASEFPFCTTSITNNVLSWEHRVQLYRQLLSKLTSEILVHF